LDTLGVRVAKLEKGADAVKVTGNIRYHYQQNHGGDKADANQLRSRIFVKGAINDDWTYTGMIEHNDKYQNDGHEEDDVTFQRAYVEGKLGGLAVTAGRWSNLVGEGNIWDSRMDAVKVVYGKDVKFTAVYGEADASSAKQQFEKYASYELAGKVGVVGLTAGYYDFSDGLKASKDEDDKVIPGAWEPNGAEDKEIWAVAANMPVAKDLKFGAMYLKGDTDLAGAEDDGYVLTLAYKGAKASVPGSWGLTAKYYDQPLATYADHTMNGYADSFKAADGGFKGYGLFANYALAKNIVAQVEWYDLEPQKGTKEVETLWTQVVFTF
ncbi:MAG: hypothetical protein IKK97_02355, partial [Phascolarctobacterium sp.]|nr:hypothetical protein [Phascolarctobacterium sp.]